MSEFEWIDRYLKPLAKSAEAMGLENDVAMLRPPGDGYTAIVTMDTIVEGIHFLPDDPLDTVARKLMRINVSDVICKGGVPAQAMLSMALPNWFDDAAMQVFTAGLSADLEAFNVNLVGGDMVSTTGPLVLSLALTAVTGGSGPTTRAGARPGDLIFVTGRIGRGLSGLEAARDGEKADAADFYRVPEIPGVQVAGLVSRFASSSIDVSDGLVSEALHICSASGCGMRIDLERVAWAEPEPALSRMLSFATAGDDYQTLMTIPPDKQGDFQAMATESGLECRLIGRMERGDGLSLFLDGEPVEMPANSGFQHARRD